MILRLKRPRYYPLKVRNGFKIARTTEPMKRLGFATFRTLKTARYMGSLWYGNFKGFDKISYPNKR